MNRRTLLIGAGGIATLAGAGAIGFRTATGSTDGYARYAAGLRRQPADPGIGDIIRYATLAANGHNTQPWRFRVEEGAIDILPDPSRRTPVVDPDDHHLFVSLGCAAENLAIAGTASGAAGSLETHADGSLRYAFARSVPRPDPLLAAITRRQSTRGTYDGRPVPGVAIEMLRRAAQRDGVRLVILTERSRIDHLRDLVVAGNDVQMRDPAFRAELKQWLRFNPRSAIAKGDGLYAATSGNPILPDAVGQRAFDLFFTASAENDKVARHIDSSAGIAVFLGERADRPHWIEVGRACQRFALMATMLGIRHAFVNQPVEVARLRPELAALAGESGLRPDIVMRFGYGPELPFSPRRPVAAVMT